MPDLKSHPTTETSETDSEAISQRLGSSIGQEYKSDNKDSTSNTNKATDRKNRKVQAILLMMPVIMFVDTLSVLRTSMSLDDLENITSLNLLTISDFLTILLVEVVLSMGNWSPAE